MKGEMNKGIHLLYKLKESYDNRSKSTLYSLIIFNLAKALSESERYKECVEICDIGKKVCLDIGDTGMLPGIITYKANCLYELGDTENARNLFKQAYYGFEILEKFEDRNAVKACMDEIGLEL
jgi:tetratricopeptide (TPR) repeat protein